MRVIVVDIAERKRPCLVTPKKGCEGDRCMECQAAQTDIGRILERYAGNLAELAGWQTRGVYGDAPVQSLEDAFEIMRAAHDDLVNSDLPFDSMADALEAFGNGTLLSRVRDFNARKNERIVKEKQIIKEKENEKKADQPEEI